jgi:hypothetical protein
MEKYPQSKINEETDSSTYPLLCNPKVLPSVMQEFLPKNKSLTNADLIEIGFKEIPHFTVANSVIYQLGRYRHLSAGCVGTPNEMLWICATDEENEKKITDLVCIHNWDYDGALTIEKVQSLIKAL